MKFSVGYAGGEAFIEMMAEKLRGLMETSSVSNDTEESPV